MNFSPDDFPVLELLPETLHIDLFVEGSPGKQNPCPSGTSNCRDLEIAWIKYFDQSLKKDCLKHWTRVNGRPIWAHEIS